MCLAVYVFYVHTHTHSAIARHSKLPLQCHKTQLVSSEQESKRKREKITTQRRRICSLKRIAPLSQRESRARRIRAQHALTHLPRVVFMNETDYNEWRPAPPATQPRCQRRCRRHLRCRCCLPFVVWAGKDKICFCFCLIKKLLFLSLARLLCYFI